MKTIKIILLSGIIIISALTSCSNESENSFAYGNFESEEIFIPAENNGILKELLIEEGDKIKSGQKIGQTDTLQLYLKKQQVIAARKAVIARLDQINSQIKVQQVSLANLEREYKRFGTLFLEEAATKKQLDDLEGQINITKAQIESLNTQKLSIYAEMDSQEAQVKQLEDQISRSTLTAPSGGQVLETYLNQGEMAIAGRPVIKIADLSELILRVFIDGDQLSSIAIGDRVKVLFDGPQGLSSTEGVISWVSPEAEFTPKIIQTREERVNLVYAVKVRVPNDGSMKIGMPGEIQLLNKIK